MPIWLMGYTAYRLPVLKAKPFVNWLFVFAALLITFILINILPTFPYGVGELPLGFAGAFISDFIVGLFVAIALSLLPKKDGLNISSIVASKFRIVADFTFPIYVLHYPLIILYRALFQFKQNNIVQLWQAIISVLIVSVLIGIVLEKQRPIWNTFFKSILNFKYPKMVLTRISS